ncbi:hypothetical protein HZY88_08525 [Aerococcaceae bacterium DSM 111176]|nr:hypothetical protein [Aerococcaceae bacterium DSM 111176]
MTKYNFNYEELGFESEEELQESIARVERRKNMSEVEEEIESLNTRTIDSKGNIDFEAMNAGARLEYLDRLVQSKMYEAQQEAKRQAEQAKMQGLMSGLSEHVDKEKKEKAQRELDKAKQKADAELQKEIFEKHGVKTDKQQADDEALRSMLKDL